MTGRQDWDDLSEKDDTFLPLLSPETVSMKVKELFRVMEI